MQPLTTATMQDVGAIREAMHAAGVGVFDLLLADAVESVCQQQPRPVLPQALTFATTKQYLARLRGTYPGLRRLDQILANVFVELQGYVHHAVEDQ